MNRHNLKKARRVLIETTIIMVLTVTGLIIFQILVSRGAFGTSFLDQILKTAIAAGLFFGGMYALVLLTRVRRSTRSGIKTITTSPSDEYYSK